MFRLAFLGGTAAPRFFDNLPSWPVPLMVCLCLAIAGGMMLFSPERAFRTAMKPRWLGLPFFAVGVVGACEWITRVFSP
jgi:hypothetical protein